MTEELKPCPFCGGEAELDWELDDEHGPSAWITCSKCKAEVRCDYQPDAITAWNTHLSRSAALIEALEGLVARLEDYAATAKRAVANSEGLADHKLLILANYGDLALQMAPAFRSTLLSMRNNGNG